ncbi:DegT/DnrJ/EryC1/StrS family aminotransferase [Alteribacillus sp. JSM 102045]|uniref:DegT/DnrJ/EryC1/StrS family aminotransferase n=1 Tax=Alteribacillus sp. JSM 102045 TaxID=1562101 RepID=UPI0035C26B48
MIQLSKPIVTDEEIEMVNKVLRSGMFVQSEHVQLFEKSLGEFMGVNKVLAVSSGTAALHLSLQALGIKEGNAVFLPAFTFPATANVVELQRARPILVDVEEETYNIDPKKLEKSILDWKGPETPKAIIIVHQFGAPCNMTKISSIAKKYGLFLIEDAACALGTKWQGKHAGTFGDVGCFSWHPRKSITTGEGGAVVVKDDNLNKQLLLLKNHGLDKSSEGNVNLILPGFNYRLTEFQAALGNEQLKKFNYWIEKRKTLVEYYNEFFKNVSNIQLPKKISGHAWQTFMIVIKRQTSQSKLIAEMRKKNVEINIGSHALHMLDFYEKKYKYNINDFPVSKQLYRQGIALPLYPGLEKKDIHYICSSFKEILNRS